MKNEALIIVDMSNDFVADNGGLTVGKPAQEIVPYIIEKANEFIANGGTVVIAMDAHQENDPHFEVWPVHNVIGTKGQELYGELMTWFKQFQLHPNVIVQPKTDYNAFHDTQLALKLKSRFIEKVHVTGVCTDICNLLTVAGANANGFKTAIHVKGSATFSEKGPAAIEHMKAIFNTEIID